VKQTIAVTGLNAGENPQPGPGVIRSLRRRFPDVRIIGLAYGALESGIYAAEGPDTIFQIPYPSAGIDALLERLDYIQRQVPFELLIPTLDAEIQPLIQAQARLAERGIQMVLPTLESFQARSKERLENLVEDLDISIPQSTSVFTVGALMEAADDVQYPLMVKGPYYDAIKVFSDKALQAAFHKIMGEWGGPVIVQEFVAGEEFNVAALGDGTGEILAACAVRKTVRSEKGKGFGGIVVEDPDLKKMSEQLIQKLQWNGSCELEFIQDAQTGKFYLLEINPRFPAWIDFPSTFEYNLPGLLIDRMVGAEPEPLPAQCPVGHFFLRHSVDISGRIEEMGHLTTFGEMYRSKSGVQS
jgi:carbamoyl-phosphate synthase large subunit